MLIIDWVRRLGTSTWKPVSPYCTYYLRLGAAKEKWRGSHLISSIINTIVAWNFLEFFPILEFLIFNWETRGDIICTESGADGFINDVVVIY